jgi:hypothetical protein
MGKHPAEWTPKDIDTILDRSAWASPATLEFSPVAFQAAPGKPNRRVAAAQGLRDKRILTDYKILVRWESALPMRLARRVPSPPGIEETRYVLSMSRLPMALFATLSSSGKARNDDSDAANKARIAEQVLKSSLLECENKTPFHADHTEWVASDFESRILISFPFNGPRIDLSDLSVAFVSQIGELIVRTSFPLRRMIYAGKLEL